jgi:hypothetical protein
MAVYVIFASIVPCGPVSFRSKQTANVVVGSARLAGDFDSVGPALTGLHHKVGTIAISDFSETAERSARTEEVAERPQ